MLCEAFVSLCIFVLCTCLTCEVFEACSYNQAQRKASESISFHVCPD